MMETHINLDSCRLLAQFSAQGRGGVRAGVKPLLSFSGSGWEGSEEGGDQRLGRAKSLLVDFFRGGEVSEVDVESLQFLISFFASDPPPTSSGEEALGPKIHMRCYKLSTSKSANSKLPRVELQEIGPRVDFRIGRIKEPDAAVWKEAMKKAKEQKEKVKKNVQTDEMGDKMGRIHLGRQDLGALQTRKVKGLKRERTEDVVNDREDVISEEDYFSMDGVDDDGVETKRQRIV